MIQNNELSQEMMSSQFKPPLEGKVALVTGASQSIGRAIAERLSRPRWVGWEHLKMQPMSWPSSPVKMRVGSQANIFLPMAQHISKKKKRRNKMSPLLITGATGHVGMHLISLLHAQGYSVRALVRDRTKAAGLPDDVEVVVDDLAQPETLPAAFAGVERVFLLDASHGLDLTRNVLAAAREARVQRIVTQSSTGAGLDPMPIMGRRFAAREAMIRESGMTWTFLRPSYLMSNALWWLPSLKAEGIVRDAMGPGRFSSIDPDVPPTSFERWCRRNASAFAW